MKTPTRQLQLGAAGAVALCLTACGGTKHATPPPPPTLSHALGATLAAQSDAVASALAAGNSCSALILAKQLQHQTIAAINHGSVPAPLQEQLAGSVNELVARVQCVPTPAPAPPPEGDEQGHGKHKGHDKNHKDED
jgi:hypothetical protein